MPSLDGGRAVTVCLERYRAEREERRALAPPEPDRPATLAPPFGNAIESKALSPASLEHRRRMLAHLARSGTSHAPRERQPL